MNAALNFGVPQSSKPTGSTELTCVQYVSFLMKGTFSNESSGLVIVKTLKVAQQLVLEAYLSISVQISSFQREWLEQLHIGSVVIVM